MLKLASGDDRPPESMRAPPKKKKQMLADAKDKKQPSVLRFFTPIGAKDTDRGY